jgi:hypothetical protein
MGFPLEVVCVGKQNITGILKYAENDENDGLDGKILKNRMFKKMAVKTDFKCESYALLKKDINNNQRATW